MARPKKSERPESTKERILVAASELFGASGFQGVTLDAIAKRVGIRAPSLLYHFKSKAEIYEAVVERFYGRLSQLLVPTSIPVGDQPADAFLLLLSAIRGLAEADRRLLVTIILELLHDGRGGATVASAVGPVMDALCGHVVGTLGLEGAAASRVRPILGLLVMGAVLELESERVPPAVAALRATIWGGEADILDIATILVGALGQPKDSG